jgi:hypothetical protein
MDTKQIFDSFLNDLKSSFPEFEIPEYSVDEVVKQIETDYYADVLKIIQHDETFFSKPRMFSKIDLRDFYCESTSEAIWKHLQLCVLCSFLHGDIKEKMKTILSTVKGMWNSSGQENDEIKQILEDEHAEDHFNELFEHIKQTRIARLFQELVDNFDISEIELNLENPTEILEMLRNPEHPTMKKVINKVQGIVKEKMERGEITQNQITADIEGIKLKAQRIFGSVINNMLGLTTNNRNRQTFPNTPEGRRERLRQRLQQRYMEEERKKNNSQ